MATQRGADLHPAATSSRSPSPALRERVASAVRRETGEGLMDERRITRARKMRRDATNAERRLWSALRDRRLDGYRIRRQYPIGPFIADFACTREQVIVEADGGQHSDGKTDNRRTAWLASQGWRVLRFWNNEILGNPEGVIDAILRELRCEDPHPAATPWRPPSPALRERG